MHLVEEGQVTAGNDTSANDYGLPAGKRLMVWCKACKRWLHGSTTEELLEVIALDAHPEVYR